MPFRQLTAGLVTLSTPALLLLGGAATMVQATAQPVVGEVLEIDRVWSGHPVGFHLLTVPPHQFVAYYDAERRMTVACRDLGARAWRTVHLPSAVVWDSHNYITMTLDTEGHIHLAGNMHCVPLIYFRTTIPRDIDSFVRVPEMVGRDEKRCTYPKFMTGLDGELIFHYRDGGSGNGNEIYNVYDVATRQWTRLLDRPLTDGEGKMNAYAVGPLKGPDGRFHLCWMWRDHPGCESNHDISYARSPDLRRWETAGGVPVALPMTLGTPGLVVDPSPPRGGLINMGHSIGFDAEQRPILTYHRYDAAGNSQLYCARWEDGQWVIHQTSSWDWRWDFSGGGSVPCLVRGSAVRVDAEGRLILGYSHSRNGSGTWQLDPRTLKPIGTVTTPPSRPAGLGRPQSDFPEMQVRWASDTGDSGVAGRRYHLRWETLGPNRDRPRQPPLPDPTILHLYAIDAGAAADQ